MLRFDVPICTIEGQTQAVGKCESHSLTAEPRVREEDEILHRAEPQFPPPLCACVSATVGFGITLEGFKASRSKHKRT